MEKVFVVKSVNVCDDSRIMTDDKGIGVFATYEEAKKCFDKNVTDLKEIYEGAQYEMEDVIENTSPYNEPYTEEFYAYYTDRRGYHNCDYVTIYECKLGEWN